MARIQVLDRHVAELIAAGEVVERPSSVVKELVENSIDAGATAVTVELQRGGITYLRITDNGCGIAREDVPTAFLRHATSKVHTEEDLSGIGTLGFRGEALASVAAVAKVDMLTRTAQEEIGTRYRIEGGIEALCDDAGCPEGTTLIVRDLFYNTPARMKFLKKDVTEANAVADIIDRLALTHPEISFRLIRDGKETLLTPGDGKLLSAIHAVYGGEFASALLPAEYSHGGIRMDGYISKPTAARANRNMQHFIVNGRFVKTKTAMAALSEGYKNSIMVGKFPACVLRFAIPPEQVDVNVHPAKTEVRFVQEKPIFDTVYFGVKTALAQRDSRPVMDLSPRRPVAPPPPPAGEPITLWESKALEGARRVERAGQPAQKEAISAPPPISRPEQRPTKSEHSIPPLPPVPSVPAHTVKEEPSILEDAGTASVGGRVEIRYPSIPEQNRHTMEAAEEKPAEVPIPDDSEKECGDMSRAVPPEEKNAEPDRSFLPELPVRLLGEAFATYILVEVGEELLLIDKHAAHERILYDRLMAGRAAPQGQMLFEPVTVTLSKEEYSAFLQHLDLVIKAGFDISDFGSGTLLVRAVPLEVQGSDIPLLIQEIAGKFADCRQEVSLDHLDWIYHSVACRAAVKAGDWSDPEELRVLARQIAADQSVMYCPHGRPVAIRLTKREIEKQFGRIQ